MALVKKERQVSNKAICNKISEESGIVGSSLLPTEEKDFKAKFLFKVYF